MNQEKQLTFVVPFHNFDHNQLAFKSLAHKLSGEKIVVRLVCDSLNKQEFENLSALIFSLTNLNCEWEIIEGKFGSAGAARNAGMKDIRTEWFGFLDCDDDANIAEYIDLCKQYNTKDIDLIVGQILLREKNAVKFSEVTDTYNLVSIARYPAFTRVIYRTEVCADLMFPTFPLGEDQVFLAKAVIRARKIHFSNVPLYVYTVRDPEQTTSKKIDAGLLEIALDELLKINSDGSRQQRDFLRLIQLRMEMSILKRMCPLTLKLLFKTFIRIFATLLTSPRLISKLNSGLKDV